MEKRERANYLRASWETRTYMRTEKRPEEESGGTSNPLLRKSARRSAKEKKDNLKGVEGTSPGGGEKTQFTKERHIIHGKR